MEKLEAISKAYQLIITALTDKFGKQGYGIAEQKEHDEAFGSRYTIWSNNREKFRLTWDGEDNLFILEASTDLSVSMPTTW